MTLSTIGIGSTANDGTGDDLRTAAAKLNANFNDLNARLAAVVTPGSVAAWRLSVNLATLDADNDPQANTIAHMVGADSASVRFVMDAYAGTPNVMLRRSNGTAASPTAVANSNVLGQFSASGFGATAFAQGRATIAAMASQDWSDSAQGTYWVVQVTPNGSTSQTSVARWTSGGLNLGSNADPTSTLTVLGSIATQPQASNITASTYSVAATDADLVFAASGTCTVTLPAASSCPGRVLWLNTETAQAVISASANVIARAGGSAGTAILAASAGSWARLKSNGTAWKIMAGA